MHVPSPVEKPQPGRCSLVGGSVIPLTRKLWVRSLIGACTEDKQLMFLSHINVFHSLPSLLSKINKHFLKF